MLDGVINRITSEVVVAVEVLLEQFLNDFTIALGRSAGPTRDQSRQLADLREQVAVRDKEIRYLKGQVI